MFLILYRTSLGFVTITGYDILKNVLLVVAAICSSDSSRTSACSISSTLLKSHLIRSRRGLIEHSTRGMRAWYTRCSRRPPAAERGRLLSLQTILKLFASSSLVIPF